MYIYTVKAGDTINSIAASAEVSPSLIINTNFPPFPNNPAVGQDFVILTPTQTYTVNSGDTIFSIAQEFNITQWELLRNNPSLAGREIYPGETIVISYSDNPTEQIITNGYAYTSINETILRRTLPYLTYITIFTYGFTPDGELVYPDDDKLISIALSYGTQPVMHLSTLTESGGFSSSLAADILNNPTAQNNLIENIIQNIQIKGYKGLDVDFEFLPVAEKDKYINFVSTLTDRLNSLGYVSLVALAPKTSVNQPGLLYESHDYAGLGAAANLVLLMTYEWGYTYHHISYK